MSCVGERYGHDDAGGREALDSVFAHIVGAEAAIVRPQFFSGTHAIACALFALLWPGHELLAVAGPPYDTLEEVIGIRDSANVGSLKDFGVTYREVPQMVALTGRACLCRQTGDWVRAHTEVLWLLVAQEPRRR